MLYLAIYDYLCCICLNMTIYAIYDYLWLYMLYMLNMPIYDYIWYIWWIWLYMINMTIYATNGEICRLIFQSRNRSVDWIVQSKFATLDAICRMICQSKSVGWKINRQTKINLSMDFFNLGCSGPSTQWSRPCRRGPSASPRTRIRNRLASGSREEPSQADPPTQPSSWSCNRSPRSAGLSAQLLLDALHLDLVHAHRPRTTQRMARAWSGAPASAPPSACPWLAKWPLGD